MGEAQREFKEEPTIACSNPPVRLFFPSRVLAVSKIHSAYPLWYCRNREPDRWSKDRSVNNSPTSGKVSAFRLGSGLGLGLRDLRKVRVRVGVIEGEMWFRRSGVRVLSVKHQCS